MTTTLITEANKGPGFETARRLSAAGHTAYVGSRDADRGRRTAEQLGARMVVIDVTSAAAAAKTIEADGVWGSKSRPTRPDLVICVFSSQSMIVRCGVASALPDLPPPSESVDVAWSLVGVQGHRTSGIAA